MLSSAPDAVLILIDIQERLAAAMPDKARQRVYRNAGILAQAAAQLGIPRLLTEQYPKGLGPTAGAIEEHLDSSVERFEKTCFSSTGAAGLMDWLTAFGRKQVVLAGMEAHVCVLQTAFELTAGGWSVFVAQDAICSRRDGHYRNAVARMRRAGVVVSNTESILFEWLRDASHPDFKALSKLVR